MELFVAGLVLGVLLTLCAAGQGDARMVHGHQPKVPPTDWGRVIPPRAGSAAQPPTWRPDRTRPDPDLIGRDYAP